METKIERLIALLNQKKTKEFNECIWFLRDDCNEIIFKNIDLQGLSLQGVDFSKLDLQGANLKDADLSSAKFDYCDLTNADLSGANLENASLHGAILAGTDLSLTNLREARIITNITNTLLVDAHFHNTRIIFREKKVSITDDDE